MLALGVVAALVLILFWKFILLGQIPDERRLAPSVLPLEVGKRSSASSTQPGDRGLDFTVVSLYPVYW